MESGDEIKRPKEAITRLMVNGFRSMKVVQTNLIITYLAGQCF